MNLDPDDWNNTRRLGYRMVDDVIAYMRGVAEDPVWCGMPPNVRASFRSPTPSAPNDLAAVYDEFTKSILPHAVGNVHPRFMGWVHGGGNIAGVFAEFLAAGLNANLGGRDHAPVEVERQVIRWASEMFGFPPDAGGLLVTGSSMANFIAVLVARTSAMGTAVRRQGLGGRKLVAYASGAAHGCIARAMEMSGLGSDALHIVPCDDQQRINLTALQEMVTRDRAEGFEPFLLIGTAGTVAVGAIDPLDSLAAFARREGLWFHVDGAFGALTVLAPSLRDHVRGIERADSIAFDFHKWGQVPYDAGCILVRDAAKQMETFSLPASYLRRYNRGLADGQPWLCDFGPDLSRGFRALKVWMTLMTFGTEKIGQVVEDHCALAKILALRVDQEPELERLAPVPLNIVCFRYVDGSSDLNDLNAEIVADVQESGIAAPSTVMLGDKLAIRAALFNHRTTAEDVNIVVEAVLKFGRRRTGTVT